MVLYEFVKLIRERTTSGTYVEVQCKIDRRWLERERILIPTQYFDAFMKMKKIEVPDDEKRGLTEIILEYLENNN